MVLLTTIQTIGFDEKMFKKIILSAKKAWFLTIFLVMLIIRIKDYLYRT